MFENPAYAAASRVILMGGIALLALLLLFCILRSIRGPRVADRILSVNMAGTMIITAIIFIGCLQGDTSIIDIGLLYAMISFLGVVVFSRIYRGEYWSLKRGEQQAMEREEEQAYEEGLHSDGDD
ncbi:MAG: sodium:proton antiporter [Clostridia bacterium]|nr:sodium:proton antiporter [Clostridia bacterium]